MNKYILYFLFILALISCRKENKTNLIKPVEGKYPLVHNLHFADEKQISSVDTLAKKIISILEKKYNPQDNRPIEFDYMLYVSSNGNVEKLVVLESDLDKVDNIVMHTIKNWKLNPLLEKKPIGFRTELKFRFYRSDNTYELIKEPSNSLISYLQNSPSSYFIAVEKMPEPIGGIKAIQEKIVYPELAKKAGIEGRVFVKAYIDEKGNVTEAEIIKGIGHGCDEAAMKAVKETKFIPGKHKGKPVKVQVSVPILFRLDSNGGDKNGK